MEVRPSQRAQSPTPPSNLIQPQFLSQSMHQDTLVAASKTKRAANCVATLGTYVKLVFSFIYEFFVEVLSALGFEPSSLDIIKTMFYDPKGNAKNFADSFKDSMNACIQASFFSPDGVKDLINDRKRKYKEFCKSLKVYIDKKDLLGQLADYRNAVSTARVLLNSPIEKDQFEFSAFKDPSKFPTLSAVFKNFCSETARLLEKSESCKKKELQGSLKHLFSIYFPRVAFEIKNQPEAYIHFMKGLCSLKALSGKYLFDLLEKHFKPKNAEEKKHLETVFKGDNDDVIGYLKDQEFATSVGLRSPIDWREIFLRAITPEQFEALIPLYHVDEAKGAKKAMFVELFKQIKETEEPINIKRLDSALGQMYNLFSNFETPSDISVK